MPLGSMIGSGQGVADWDSIRRIVERLSVPIVVSRYRYAIRRGAGDGSGCIGLPDQHRDLARRRPGANGDGDARRSSPSNTVLSRRMPRAICDSVEPVDRGRAGWLIQPRARSGASGRRAISDVAIVGGGIIGCSIAYYLSLRRPRSLFLEREHLAAGASVVAAGMLAPQVEAAFDDPFFDLNAARSGRARTAGRDPPRGVGLDVEYPAAPGWCASRRMRRSGVRAFAPRFAGRWAWSRGKWIEPGDLGGRIRSSAVSSDGCWLGVSASGRRTGAGTTLVQALAAAAVKRGARFVEGAWVGGFLYIGRSSRRRANASRTDRSRHDCPRRGRREWGPWARRWRRICRSRR